MATATDLQARVDELAKRVDELTSKEAIRDCIYRVNRGLDRIDRDLLASAFHPDAQVQWGTGQPMELATFLETAIKVQHLTSRVQHLIGNILIDLRGEVADVESYEIGRHLTPLGEDGNFSPTGPNKKDLIIASRYVDRFSRRNQQWRIERRFKVADWIRIMEGADASFDRIPLKGRRDDKDISFEILGPRAFHRA